MRLTSNQRASKTGLVQKIDRCGGERGLPVDSGFRDFSKCFSPQTFPCCYLHARFLCSSSCYPSLSAVFFPISSERCFLEEEGRGDEK